MLFALHGITMGAHRYYTHRCFKASKAMQVIMLIAQSMSSQVMQSVARKQNASTGWQHVQSIFFRAACISGLGIIGNITSILTPTPTHTTLKTVSFSLTSVGSCRRDTSKSSKRARVSTSPIWTQIPSSSYRKSKLL